jgi:hypothetical protein
LFGDGEVREGPDSFSEYLQPTATAPCQT